MEQIEPIQLALENLEKITGIAGNIELNIQDENNDPDYGKYNDKLITPKPTTGEVVMMYLNKAYHFNYIYRQELRITQIPLLTKPGRHNYPLMIIADHIFPLIKQHLRDNKIPYLETNGNAWLPLGENLIFIDTNKPLEFKKEKVNRAFTKTGLKAVFYFLNNKNRIKQTYREIANDTGIGLGNVNNVIKGLEEVGFVLRINKKEIRLRDETLLLEKWAGLYNERLKPMLGMGTFRFMTRKEEDNWQEIQFQHQTCWGGEPAGALLTKYLKPEIFTIYTTETRNELIQKYRVIPDPNGNIRIYEKFWDNSIGIDQVVPPILAYADLINVNNTRCDETAKMIYERYIVKQL